MAKFCPKAGRNTRCVLSINHIGSCSLQSNSSVTVRKILKQEEDEKKMGDS